MTPYEVIVEALAEWSGDYWEEDGQGAGPSTDVLAALVAHGYAILGDQEPQARPARRPAFIVARSDGEPMQGEYAFFAATTPDEWDGVEAEWDFDHPDTPQHYVMLRVDPVPVARCTVMPSGAVVKS